MTNGSVRTNELDYSHQITLPAFDVLDRLLVAVDNHMDFRADAKLDAFFVHVVNVFALNVVSIDGVAEELEIFANGGRVQGFGPTFLEPCRPLDFEVGVTFLKTLRLRIAYGCSMDFGGIVADEGKGEWKTTATHYLSDVRKKSRHAVVNHSP